METYIVTITGRSICSVNSSCDNNEMFICSAIVTITRSCTCSVSSYCDNNDTNGEFYM